MADSTAYTDFLARKRRVWTGQAIPLSTLPPQLFDWQAAIVRWALRKGRAAIFSDCGTGKSFMQLAWAQNVPGRVLIVAPLCVAEQTILEGAKLDIPVVYAKRGTDSDARLTITNYERLDAFDPTDYQGVVLDESSILKSFDGATRTKLIEMFQRTPYRLCCTATPSPNDIAELANHAEFLGLMTRAEFLATWFIRIDQGKRTTTHHGWRMKGHAVQPFYRWLASWAVALRKPSDIGYADDGFELPPLRIHEHIVEGSGDGQSLFPELGLYGIQGRLSARRSSQDARIEATVNLIHEWGVPWIVWCGLNSESDALARTLTNAVNVSGSDSHDAKVSAIRAFLDGRIKVFVSKLKIAGFGLNLQHCHHMVFVGIGDSYEQYYQGIRRCWRFGQQYPVDVHIVVSDAERGIVANVRQKEQRAQDLASGLLEHMRDFEREELAS